MLQQPCVQMQRVICLAPTTMTDIVVSGSAHILIANASQGIKKEVTTLRKYNFVLPTMEDPCWHFFTFLQCVPTLSIGISINLRQSEHLGTAHLSIFLRQSSNKASADAHHCGEHVRLTYCQRLSTRRTHGQPGNVDARFVHKMPLANVRQYEQDFID